MGSAGHPRRFDFCDFVTDEEEALFRRAQKARSAAFLRALRMYETKQQSKQLREGPGVRFQRSSTASNMTSPAALCADLMPDIAD